MEQDKIETVINGWIKTSDENHDAMIDIYNSKRYSWSLFLGHLYIEKLLKAYYLKTKLDHAPYLHNLLRLAELSGLSLTADRKKDFSNYNNL